MCRCGTSAGSAAAPGHLRTFAKLSLLQRSFPKPAIRGTVQQYLTRQGQQCGRSGHWKRPVLIVTYEVKKRGGG